MGVWILVCFYKLVSFSAVLLMTSCNIVAKMKKKKKSVHYSFPNGASTTLVFIHQWNWCWWYKIEKLWTKNIYQSRYSRGHGKLTWMSSINKVRNVRLVKLIKKWWQCVNTTTPSSQKTISSLFSGLVRGVLLGLFLCYVVQMLSARMQHCSRTEWMNLYYWINQVSYSNKLRNVLIYVFLPQFREQFCSSLMFSCSRSYINFPTFLTGITD